MSSNSQPAAPNNQLHATLSDKCLSTCLQDWWFCHFLALLTPDIAIIMETKLRDDKMSQAETANPGFGPPLRRDRTAQGGGVAVWVRSEFAAIELDTIPCGPYEIIWFSARLWCGQAAVVAALNRSGSASEGDTRLMEYLDSHLNAVRQQGTHLILAGDFNVHNTDWLGSAKTTPAGEAMEVLSAAHYLTQHVSEPTRGNNTIDLILSDFNTPVIAKLHAPLGRSDHACVVADFLQAPLHRQPTTSRRAWRYNKADRPRLRHFFRRTNWSTVITDDIDHSCELLTEVVAQGMMRFILSKVLKLQCTDPVWWTPECSDAINSNHKA